MSWQLPRYFRVIKEQSLLLSLNNFRNLEVLLEEKVPTLFPISCIQHCGCQCDEVILSFNFF